MACPPGGQRQPSRPAGDTVTSSRSVNATDRTGWIHRPRRTDGREHASLSTAAQTGQRRGSTNHPTTKDSHHGMGNRPVQPRQTEAVELAGDPSGCSATRRLQVHHPRTALHGNSDQRGPHRRSPRLNGQPAIGTALSLPTLPRATHSSPRPRSDAATTRPRTTPAGTAPRTRLNRGRHNNPLRTPRRLLNVLQLRPCVRTPQLFPAHSIHMTPRHNPAPPPYTAPERTAARGVRYLKRSLAHADVQRG